MKRGGGLMTRADLKAYEAKKRVPLRGTYRGYDVLTMPPISSGGTALLQMLNVLEGYDLKQHGYGSAATVHLLAETMRRAFADRARYLGDPEFNPTLAATVQRLISKPYAEELRKTIADGRASTSSPTSFEWPAESDGNHAPLRDRPGAQHGRAHLHARVRLRLAHRGAGRRVPAEQRDGRLQRGPGADGRRRPHRHRAQPGRARQAHAVEHDPGHPGRRTASRSCSVGAMGGRTIINTVLLTILNVVDFGMNIQDALDAPRFHHQWLPDRIAYEPFGLSPDTRALLESRGHSLFEIAGNQGNAQAIVYDAKAGVLEGGADIRDPDGAAVGR